MSVFKVNNNFDVILNPDAVKLVPELTALTKEELLYVILVVDYADSPYRMKPLEERRAMAAKRIFSDTKKNVETAKVLNAMDCYKSLVFDIRRETKDIYSEKISVLQRETLTKDVSFGRMKEIDSTISFLQTRIDSIDKSLYTEEISNIVLKGKRELSYIEEWQRKQRDYNEFKNAQ